MQRRVVCDVFLIYLSGVSTRLVLFERFKVCSKRPGREGLRAQWPPVLARRKLGLTRSATTSPGHVTASGYEFFIYEKQTSSYKYNVNCLFTFSFEPFTTERTILMIKGITNRGRKIFVIFSYKPLQTS